MKGAINPLLTRAAYAVLAAGLRYRNWSGGGRLVLAVYEPGDLYVGTVEVRGEKLGVGTGRHSRRERQLLEKVCQRFGEGS